jgi:hypothetical protein
VNWIGNVIAPIGAALAVVMAVVSHHKRGVMRWSVTAGGLLVISGLTRLIDSGSKTAREACSSKDKSHDTASDHRRLDEAALRPGCAIRDLRFGARGDRFAPGRWNELCRRGNFPKCMLWSVIFLTLPQIVSWMAAQGIVLPPQGGNISSAWVNGVETSFNHFVADVVVGRLVPVLADFFVLKAALDAAQGQNFLSSVVAAIFLLAVSSTVQLMKTWNRALNLR